MSLKIIKPRKALNKAFLKIKPNRIEIENFKANLIKLIENEAENAKKGLKAEIKLKMNALTESGIIKALYKASQAGVSINLVIRSICCLKPGIKGLSENTPHISTQGRISPALVVYLTT